MRRNPIIEVLNAWTHGRTLSTGTLHTSDNELFSYALKIGEKIGDELVVYDHTAPGGNFNSITTSTHVNLAKYYCDKVINFNGESSNSRW